jgi:sterol desaturase/sphingolipid hydroxylase (fatty acid hydroxylase superfamily)
MDELELRKLQVEAWKTTIEVQQHFNDIEMRIRALAITVLTAVLGAAALAVRSGTTLHVGGVHIDLGGAIIVIGLLAWLLFYFVDNWWYHRLLLGAVEHGRALEEMLGKGGVPGFGLTKAIGDASPFTFKLRLFKKVLWTKDVHSSWKARIFYFVIAAILIIAAIFLFSNKVTPATSKKKAHTTTTAKTATLPSTTTTP